MINNFVDNPFLNSRLGDAEFGQFTNSHLEFLIAANTNNQYTTIIAALQTAYRPFKLYLEKYDKNITNRKGKTQTVDAILASFKEFVKKEVYKEVNYKFGEGTENYNEFFPKGLNEYNKLTKKNANVLLDRIEKATEKHKTNLIGGLNTKALAFNTDYTTALSHQLGGKGSVKDTSEEGASLRIELAWVLYDNLLEQLKISKRNTKSILSLYDTKYLNINKGKKKKTEINKI